VLFTTPEHLELRDIAQECITRHHFHHYRGMSQNRWRAFSEDDANEVKPLLYAFRALLTGLHLLRTGEVEADINALNEVYRLPFIPDLVSVKREGSEHESVNTSAMLFIARQFELLSEQLEEAHEASELPDAPTEEARNRLDDLLVRLRLGEESSFGALAE
jgi:predicted nucleotidyltransferase